jgi:hypothetical protein
VQVVLKAIAGHAVQKPFAYMAERSVPQVVPQRYGLGEVFIEPQSPGNGPCNLGHFQSMGKSRPVMVAFGRYKYLGFVLQPAEGFTVQYPVAVSLKLGTYLAFLQWISPSPGSTAETSIRRKNLFFQLFNPLPDHKVSTSFSKNQNFYISYIIYTTFIPDILLKLTISRNYSVASIR